MSYKHTPGPWNCMRASAAGRNIICSDTRPVDICVLSNRDKTQTEIDANARLIAAAPDLLAACQRALDWLASYPGGNADRAWEQVRDAIVKATEGQSC